MQLASKLQLIHGDVFVPDVILNSVAVMMGDLGPLHRAVARIIMNQRFCLPKCVLEILLDNLEVWGGSVRDCALLYLATQWERRMILEMLMTKFRGPTRESRSGAFPPLLRGIIQDIARKAMTSPKASAADLKFWAVNAVLKYPGSGIMELVIQLDKKFLPAIYQVWLEEAFKESLS